MSSATMTNMGAARGALDAAEEATEEIPNNGLSPRQLKLNRLWSYFRCENYDGRKTGWNGQPHLEGTEREFVASQGFLPPGFYDAGQTMPVELRRPDTPFYLGKVVPQRFTSLLFSERRHPKVAVPDDPKTEDWLNAAIEQGRLWAHMINVRNYGGGMGTVALGFKFVQGRVQFELHDARWCTPEFADPDTQELFQLEKRYLFTDWIRDPKTGGWVEGRFWYRRLITTESDIVWPKVPVRDGDEPDWDKARHSEVVHGFGFCPAVWIQNHPVVDEIDGDPDCHGAYELIEKCDQLRAQGTKGVMANCDPTLNINTDADFEDVGTGANNAIKLEKGGSAQYLELSGTATKSAYDSADSLEEKVLTLVRCYLDTNTGGPARTQNEVEKNYSSMIEQADILREQYGEKGVKRLLELLLRAARTLGTARAIPDPDGGPARIVRMVVKLPPKVEVDEATGAVVSRVPRELGQGEQVELNWPPYFQPTLDDVGKAVIAAGQAKTFNIVDLDHAVRFVAGYFQVEDVKKLVKELSAKQNEIDDQLQAQLTARMTNPQAFGSPKPPGGGK